MINFIVCDDEVVFRKNAIAAIDDLKKKLSFESKVHEFTKYDSDFEALINSNLSCKIYILDIELPNGISGIDIARKIRRTDWNSIIIMLTSHSELTYEALKAQIMLFDFISKFNDCKNSLEKALLKAVRKVNQKKVFNYTSSGMNCRIYLDDILYVSKDSVERKCVIKTTYNEVVINMTLTEMMSELDDRFYCSHRSCLVNTERIAGVKWADGIITFDNGESTYLLARDKKKGLKEYVSELVDMA